MGIIIKLPIRTWLRKYVYHIEECPEDEPIRLAKGGVIPYQLQLLLSGKTVALVDDTQLPSDINDHLPVLVNAKQWDRGYLFMGHKHATAFNRLLQRWVYERLIDRFETLKIYGAPTDMTALIIDMLSEIDAVDDVDYDTLCRGLRRYKKAKADRYHESTVDLEAFRAQKKSRPIRKQLYLF